LARSAIDARTDSRRVAAQQVQLERAERLVRNARLCERTKPRIDPVDRFVPLGRAIDDGARAIHARGGVLRQRDEGVLVGNRDQIVERERLAVERDHENCGVEYCSYEYRGARRAMG
jgi:hypothetical protein